MSVERERLEIKNLSAINCKAMKEDPTIERWISQEIYSAKLEKENDNTSKTTARLTQPLYLQQYFGLSNQPSSGLDVIEL